MIYVMIMIDMINTELSNHKNHSNQTNQSSDKLGRQHSVMYDEPKELQTTNYKLQTTNYKLYYRTVFVFSIINILNSAGLTVATPACKIIL